LYERQGTRDGGSDGNGRVEKEKETEKEGYGEKECARVRKWDTKSERKPERERVVEQRPFKRKQETEKERFGVWGEAVKEREGEEMEGEDQVIKKEKGGRERERERERNAHDLDEEV